MGKTSVKTLIYLIEELIKEIRKTDPINKLAENAASFLNAHNLTEVNEKEETTNG